MSPVIPPDALADLHAAAHPRSIVEGNDRDPHLTEWRGRWQGETPLVLAPASTAELSALVEICHRHRVPMVPQGGNTGLVGAQIPRGEILFSMHRMTGIRQVDAESFTMTVNAGEVLANAQGAAAKLHRKFPLSIGAEGTCQIGGVLSSNAGGVNVIRYGNARDLCLGIEAVLPDGRIWNGLNDLRKNNTGYDLKHLFIGAEGTLGFITAAVFKLFPVPKETKTLFLAVPSAKAAIDLLSLAQERTGHTVTSFELMEAPVVELVLSHFSDLKRPVETCTPAYVLIELDTGREGTLDAVAEGIVTEAMERDLVVDGTISYDVSQAEGLWQIRHRASEAMKRDPAPCVKCDISVPVRNIPALLDACAPVVEDIAPGARVIAFGHVGDGNIHYDVLGPTGGDPQAFRDLFPVLERRIHDIAADLGGSISAEHGIGILKRDELAARKHPVEMDLMRTIKAALDPHGLMNPGKLL